MSKSIGKISRFFLLIGISLCFIPRFSLAQFYVSSPSCVSSGGSLTNSCDLPTTFFDTDTTSLNRTWDFGDGTILPNASRKTTYSYLNDGVYTISLTKTSATGTNINTKTITVGKYPNEPQFNKKSKADTTVCDGKSLTLNPYKHQAGIGPTGVEYLWFPRGETTPTIDVDSSGCYSVEVKDLVSGCSRTASITVKFCLQPTKSGGEPEKWYFGQHAAIDFKLGGNWESNRDTLGTDNSLFSRDSTLKNPTYSPALSTGGNKVATDGATAMVYGPDGSLKLYTDGIGIYTNEDVALNDLNGNPVTLNLATTSQGLAIVPKNSCNECPHHQYYVFGVDKTTKMLTYTLVDMRYNNRRGAVVETNVPVLYPVTERIAVTFNLDSTGYLLLAHEANTSNFTIISMDSTGLQEKNIPLGIVQDSPESQYGYMSVSPNGEKLAIGVVDGGQNFIELYTIDKQNQTLLLQQNIAMGPAPPNIYGLAFSPTSDLLYVTLQGDGVATSSQLYQLPLTVGNGTAIAAAKILIDESTTEIFGALQLGPINGDGAKAIYMTILGKTEIPYIQQPDLQGNAAVVGYTRIPGNPTIGVPLPGISGIGLPNVVYAKQKQDGDGIQASYSGNCFMAATILKTGTVCSPMRNEVEWEFENGSKLKGETVSYVFPHIGWNKIKLNITTYNPSGLPNAVIGNAIGKILDRALQTPCEKKTIIDSIYIKPSPKFNLPDTTYICTRDSPPTLYNFFPNPTGGNAFEYNWQTGTGFTIAGTNSTMDSLRIQASGNYKLTIKNDFDCETSKKFTIFDKCKPRVFAPSAFTPNNDTKNDTFLVYTAHIKNYNLKVFDRWGKIIFETDNPDTKWDGTVNGTIYAPMIYPYIITYESVDFPELGVLKKEGAIVVLK